MSFDSVHDQFFDILSVHFGAVCAALILFNAAIWWLRARPGWREDPSRRQGEQKLLLGFISFLAVPFLIMEVGTISSGHLTTWHFFRPQDGNLFVLAFFAWLWGFATIFALWVWFLGGDDFVARNLRIVTWRRWPFGKPAPLRPDDWQIKAGALLLLVVYGAATAGMIMMDAPAEVLDAMRTPPGVN